MKSFNIDNFVKIKLTSYGLSILNDYHNRVRKSHPEIGEFTFPPKDERGYIGMPLNQIMQIFGPYLGRTDAKVFESEILFDEEYLKDLPDSHKRY